MSSLETNPIPEGMHSLTPHLWFNGNCKSAIEFYQRAFSAELLSPAAFDSKNELVCHAMLHIGDSNLLLADAWPNSHEQGPKGFSSAGMWLYVRDCDAVFAQAVSAGCEVIMPLMDAFWGDRMGKVKDPFGHTWAIATHKHAASEDEIQRGMKEWEHGMRHQGCC
ncbi:MAG TPA: glyoxalase/bleomycin resistance/extradiol dioxygenase family protein [Myxococcota bacterium]|nr:glyoxalase/bleomycin resistance/extradiol dioxygenase family protein [Myxococcota bacterium]